MFKSINPPVITMGGLYEFEKSTGVSAPGFIDHLVRQGSERPDDPLSSDLIEKLVLLVSNCMPASRGSLNRVARLIKLSPEIIAEALRDFLEDPLPTVSDSSEADSASVSELPSVLDMRSAWLAGGGDPEVFDGLKLWEHSRVIRQEESRQKSEQAAAAIAARMARAKEDHFRRFVSELHGGDRAMGPQEWAQHLFKSTSHMPKITQEELAVLKGQA